MTQALALKRRAYAVRPILTYGLELRTSSNESLTSLVVCVLSEVLDETSSQILSLLLPLRSLSVCIAWIQDLSSYTWQLCWNLEVEHRDLLCWSLVDVTVQDSVDDTTCIADRDTLACTVPTCVNEVCLSVVLVHLLNQLLSVLCWVQLQECLAEASRECWSRLCDTALCTCQLSCEAREEVVLSLLWSQDRYWRQYTKCIS